jgi:hypothetical protein
MNETRPSTLKIRLMQQVIFLKGKLYRFRGNFNDAEYHLKQVLNAAPKSSSISSDVIVYLIAVYCEISNIVKARNLTELKIKYLKGLNRLHEGKGRRFRLAEAKINLISTLWPAAEGESDVSFPLQCARSLFEKVETICQGIDDGKVARLYIFRVSAGLAIISHLEGHLQNVFFR